MVNAVGHHATEGEQKIDEQAEGQTACRYQRGQALNRPGCQRELQHEEQRRQGRQNRKPRELSPKLQATEQPDARIQQRAGIHQKVFFKWKRRLRFS
ncbi:hypothetical protein [Polaromonas sp. LjRoot131]|uniref:hypothetical protein n=1 Tax=Polaromonas sp. LjRoot131 TaxID=3342262 RepID=UPI003ECC956D